ncbi:restriction endonuclease [Clostridium sp. 'White wine YQ']|uniref:restriction endonuclease n=1 Tax=Clostridium sp. 'White wine YQ' TaxID=3027474 RepID=UPI00236513E9|nr:restriction endonuclease [Clostridium sp. 'White wine YQ']MDD7792882.1 restriction endonuclease [Clostridium sp. 'White wine YQ']
MKRRLNKIQKMRRFIIFLYLIIFIYFYIYKKQKVLPIVALILIILFYVNFKNRRIEKLRNATFNEIDIMSGEEFEEYLQVKFKDLGYKCKLTPRTADYGADLILKNFKGKKVVQAKRWKSIVGVEAIQQVVASMRYYKATEAMVVTNSYYSENAKKLAKVNNVLLWDRRDIDKLIKEKYEGECPSCGGKLVLRKGPYGEFLGCSNYPKCTYKEKI